MIIAIWGNAGSGKSTLAIKLANSFVRQKKNVILVDTNYVAPQTNIWFPSLNIKKEQSLAVLLDNAITSVETVVGKVHPVSSNLGVVGYVKDFSTSMTPSRQDTAEDFFLRAPEIADVIIVDCSTNILSDILSFVALDTAADERIIAVTPDLRGLSWYDSNVKMLEENWKNNEMHYMRCFNQTHPTAPTDDIADAIGTVSYYLPFDDDLRKELYNGTLSGESFRVTSRKYSNVVDSIARELLQRHEPNVN